MIKQLLITAIVAAIVASLVVLIGIRLVGDQSAEFGASGISRYPNSGIAAKYLKVTATPGTATAGSDGGLTIGSGGTEMTKYLCATVSWNPPSVASSGNPLTNATSTSITLTGAVLGDICKATLSSNTSTLAHSLTCNIQIADTAYATYANLSATAIDNVTGTLKACFTH